MISLLYLAVLVATVAGYCGPKADAKFEVVIRPPSKLEVELGDTVSVVCAAHGHGMMDPLVYFVKGIGSSHKDKGRRIPVIAVGKATLYIPKVEAEDIDNYRCVIEDCCGKQREEIEIEIVVPDDTCKDVYGVGHIVYGATWTFRSWTDAVADCRAKGMEMAMPKTQEENAQLVLDLQASFTTHPNARKFAHDNWCWLGATDKEEENVWKTIKDGNLLEYFNWAKKQPDNKAGNDTTQNVAGIHRGNGQWDDSFVYYERPYACLCNPEQ